MAKAGPAPFTPEIVASTILTTLNISPESMHACEHGCEHSAIDYVRSQLEQLLRMAN